LTIAWFIVWLIANLIGGSEPLEADPVNAWAATLILAVAVDLNRPQFYGGSQASRAKPPEGNS
jgi:hypothetical protein